MLNLRGEVATHESLKGLIEIKVARAKSVMGFFQGVLHMRACITSMQTSHLLGFMTLCGNFIPHLMRSFMDLLHARI